MSADSSTAVILPAPAAATPRTAPLAGVLVKTGHVLVGAIVPLLLLALWQHAASAHWLPVQLLPSPALVYASFIDLWQSGDLTSNLAISLKRVGWSLLLGGGAGLVLGVLFGFSRRARAYLYPTFEVVAQFPVIGWIPLLIIFVGIGEPLKVLAISLAVIVPVTVQTTKGIAQVPRPLLDVARVYRFSLAQTITRVVLPSALPTLFNGLRQAVMQAWLALVFVELLAAGEGVGYLMVWGRQLLQLDLVVVAMILIGLVGVVLDRLLAVLEHRLQRWRRNAF
ncbi:sulfonate transport system permease protein [Silvimonas terrae]|uniref:Sulfonate transport system permease protein n=1 Tax=Silvimonas terrae TaxID=300266 RepID=A0A840RE77_9NEIS|nr:ABC transporter permease [Silvimonas terrae]MBB5191635.1 sulfonate transport system permease protein [Silvimonas terrae]